MAFEDFVGELRRRGVARAALVYCAGAFAVLEFADIAVPRLGLPDGTVDIVLWVGLGGLPAALVGSWVFELSTRQAPNTRRRWLSPLTIAVTVSLIAAGIGFSLFWGRDEPEAPTHTSPGRAASTELEPRPPSPRTPEAQLATLRAWASEPTVVVQRFSSLDDEGEHDYFAAGLSEEVGTALSRFAGVRVIAPSATESTSRSRPDTLAEARERGVEYLVRATVRRDPKQIRVAVQLLDAAKGLQLWGENYDVKLEAAALLETQDRIAGQVASAIADFSGVIMRAGRLEARHHTTNSFEAYDCVLLGLAYLEIHTEELHGHAHECLEEAIRLDPRYADAWAHLAYNYREEYHHGFNEEPGSLDRALDAARRALALDASSPIAHFAIAQTHVSRGELDAGIAAMERAVELNPNDTLALASLASYLIRFGDLERGLEIAKVTAELNPLHPTWLHFDVALYHYLRGQYRDSLDSAARVEIPDHPPTLAVRAAAQARLGEPGAGATLEALRATDRRFARAPLRELRRYFFSEATAGSVAEGLRLAGLDVD